MYRKAELTICIPAYNNNISLERALNSIKNQTIAKELDILISDDCSPNAINESNLEKFRDYFNNFKIKRQENNLGVLSNAEWLFNNIKTDFYTFLQHDDVVIDSNFYKRVIESFHKNKKLVCFFGNSIIFNSDSINAFNQEEVIKNSESMYSLDNPNVKGIKDDNSISGDNLIRNLSDEELIFNTSWSAVIFSREASLIAGGFGGGYTLSKAEALLLNVFREEEHFALLHLICCLGDCQLEKNPSVIRIIEPTSFSKSKTHPARLMSQDSCLFAMYKLASVIEANFDNLTSEKIIKIIYNHISKIALEFEGPITKKFFHAYKLKNKKYEYLFKESINKSKNLKSRFQKYKFLKEFIRFYRNKFSEKFLK